MRKKRLLTNKEHYIGYRPSRLFVLRSMAKRMRSKISLELTLIHAEICIRSAIIQAGREIHQRAKVRDARNTQCKKTPLTLQFATRVWVTASVVLSALTTRWLKK